MDCNQRVAGCYYAKLPKQMKSFKTIVKLTISGLPLGNGSVWNFGTARTGHFVFAWVVGRLEFGLRAERRLCSVAAGRSRPSNSGWDGALSMVRTDNLMARRKSGGSRQREVGASKFW